MPGPPPAVARLRSAVRTALLDARPTVLVACSGGPDSAALAAAVAFEAPRTGRAAGLVTVDHGLQPGSALIAERVARWALGLGFDPVETVRVAVDGDGGPEDAARRARYAALDELADRHDADVLLGHTLDDQAESVILGLGRGSGARSLAGMAPRRGRYLRPLLGVRRADTEAACAEVELQVWDDPHNGDPRFRRARVRAEVLPLLEDVLAGGAAEALAQTARLLRADADALDRWAAWAHTEAAAGEVDHDETPELDVATLADLPQAVRTRVLRAWITGPDDAPLTAERTSALDALVTHWHGQGPVELPAHRDVRRVGGRLVASRTV